MKDRMLEKRKALSGLILVASIFSVFGAGEAIEMSPQQSCTVGVYLISLYGSGYFSRIVSR